jgi:adenylyltransferase/sulfurtransferase
LKSQNDRYSRQILFDAIGKEGQNRLLASRVLIVDCGALGTAQDEAMDTAGFGTLLIGNRLFV